MSKHAKQFKRNYLQQGTKGLQQNIYICHISYFKLNLHLICFAYYYIPFQNVYKQ